MFAALAAQQPEGEFEDPPRRRLERYDLNPHPLGITADILQLLFKAGIIFDNDTEAAPTKDKLLQQLQPLRDRFG